jgi:hypothetical protein
MFCQVPPIVADGVLRVVPKFVDGFDAETPGA